MKQYIIILITLFIGVLSYSAADRKIQTNELHLTEASGPDKVTVKPPSLSSSWTFTLPTGAGTNGYVLSTNGSGTSSWVNSLTSFTLVTPVISTISNTGTLTLPTSTDTLVGRATTDTLTNKTLTAPVISTISNSGTLTLPTGTDTLVGRATTDTLTNKTISFASNTLTNVQPTSTLTAKGDLYVATASNTVTRLAVGADNTFLKADSGQSSGVIWASPSGAALAVTSKTTTYTATTADDIILASTSGGAWTLTLYAASGNSGKILRVKKTTNDFSVLTIDGNASETIDGATTTTLDTQYEELQIVCDGTNWHILQRHIPSVVTSYSSTWGHSTNVSATVSYWARSEDRIKIWGRITYGGANTQGALTMTIPTGLTIDTAKITSTTRATLGKHTFYDSSADIYYEGAPRYNSTTTLGFTKGEQTAGSGIDSSANRPVTFASGDFLDFFAEVPISGWKGN